MRTRFPHPTRHFGQLLERGSLVFRRGRFRHRGAFDRRSFAREVPDVEDPLAELALSLIDRVGVPRVDRHAILLRRRRRATD